jgi:ABC-type phosphate/phosphonate transport system substrate-binding protein
MNLFRATIAPVAGGAPFFSLIVVRGSHEASVTAVAEGTVDLASIDCVSFALLKRGRPDLVERVAPIAESPLSPCLPFIASARLPAATIDAVREALFATLDDPNLAEAREALGLAGARAATPADYDRVVDIERDAVAKGYARLA